MWQGSAQGSSTCPAPAPAPPRRGGLPARLPTSSAARAPGSSSWAAGRGRRDEPCVSRSRGGALPPTSGAQQLLFLQPWPPGLPPAVQVPRSPASEQHGQQGPSCGNGAGSVAEVRGEQPRCRPGTAGGPRHPVSRFSGCRSRRPNFFSRKGTEPAQAGMAHCRIPEKSLARVRQGQPYGRQSMSVLTAPQLWRCGRLHSDHARSPHLVPEPPVARGTAQTGLSQGLRRSDPKLPRGPSVLTGVLARGRREAQSQKVDEAALPAVTRGKEPRARDAAPLEAGEAGDASPGASGQPGPACTWVHPPRPVRDLNLRDCEK